MIIPRFEIGQEVFVYQHGKLNPVIIKKIIIKITEEKSSVEYLFEGERWLFSYDLGTDEEEVFASKEEFLKYV